MSNSVSSPLPADFNPWTQQFTLYLSDGTSFNATITDLDFYRWYGLRACINYASQIGACILLLVILLMLTKRDKLRSSIFVLNALCLFINSVRSILQCLYFTGPFYNPFTWLSSDFSRIPKSELGVSIAAGTLTLILTVLIMISLILQVNVVCVTTPPVQKFWILFASFTVAMIAIGFRFAVTALNNETIIHLETFTEYNWLVTAQTVTQAIAIWFFCIIFIAKLGYAIRQRRKLGMGQFGPMQIIFIMGCQTMVIPAIFTVLQFIDSVPELSTMSLTSVCIFLPLSAIWAGAMVDDRGMGARGPDAHHKLLHVDDSHQSAASYGESRMDSYMDAETVAGSAQSSPTAERYGDKGVRIESEWKVEGSRV